MPRTSLADLAHVIDRDATLTIRRVPHRDKLAPEYRGLLRIRLDLATALALRERFGGSISTEMIRGDHPRESVLYELTGSKLAEALTKLLPRMERQRALAETLIELRQLQQRPAKERTTKLLRDDGIAGIMAAPWYLDQCEALYERARTLNAQLR